MQRREVLRSLAAAAALPFLPSSVEAAAALGRTVQSRIVQGQAFRTLTAAEQALVSGLADRILPSTDTPGALDVRVPEFIDLLLTEWYDESDRDRFLEGLSAIDEFARVEAGAPFMSLDESARLGVMEALDSSGQGGDGAGAAFAQLKALTVYGYFTSERVSKEVLKTEIYFADFDGCAPVGG